MNTHGNAQCCLKFKLVSTRSPAKCHEQDADLQVLRRDGQMGSSQNSLPITSRAGPMVYGCMYCASSYNNTLATLKFAGLPHSHLLHLLVEADLLVVVLVALHSSVFSE